MNLLNNCSADVGDIMIMLVWRIWQVRNDIYHGKDPSPVLPSPVLASVDYLNSYYRSIKLTSKFSMYEIIKGKMPTVLPAPWKHQGMPAMPWPAPDAGRVALSVDGSF